MRTASRQNELAAAGGDDPAGVGAGEGTTEGGDVYFVMCILPGEHAVELAFDEEEGGEAKEVIPDPEGVRVNSTEEGRDAATRAPGSFRSRINSEFVKVDH